MTSAKLKPRRPLGLTLLSLFIGIGSISMIARQSQEGGHPGFTLISYALLVAGLYTATEIWRLRRTAIHGYIAWLLFALIRIGMAESTSSGTSNLEIVVYLGLVAVVWSLVLLYLRSALDQAIDAS